MTNSEGEIRRITNRPPPVLAVPEVSAVNYFDLTLQHDIGEHFAVSLGISIPLSLLRCLHLPIRPFVGIFVIEVIVVIEVVVIGLRERELTGLGVLAPGLVPGEPRGIQRTWGAFGPEVRSAASGSQA